MVQDRFSTDSTSASAQPLLEPITRFVAKVEILGKPAAVSAEITAGSVPDLTLRIQDAIRSGTKPEDVFVEHRFTFEQNGGAPCVEGDVTVERVRFEPLELPQIITSVCAVTPTRAPDSK